MEKQTLGLDLGKKDKQRDKRTGCGLWLGVYREAANLSLPQALAKLHSLPNQVPRPAALILAPCCLDKRLPGLGKRDYFVGGCFFWDGLFLVILDLLTPWKINGWNLQITHLERKMIWTKPPWLCSMLISRGVFDPLQ